jgi:hypothetical protein
MKYVELLRTSDLGQLALTETLLQSGVIPYYALDGATMAIGEGPRQVRVMVDQERLHEAVELLASAA